MSASRRPGGPIGFFQLSVVFGVGIGSLFSKNNAATSAALGAACERDELVDGPAAALRARGPIEPLPANHVLAQLARAGTTCVADANLPSWCGARHGP